METIKRAKRGPVHVLARIIKRSPNKPSWMSSMTKFFLLLSCQLLLRFSVRRMQKVWNFTPRSMRKLFHNFIFHRAVEFNSVRVVLFEAAASDFNCFFYSFSRVGEHQICLNWSSAVEFRAIFTHRAGLKQKSGSAVLSEACAMRWLNHLSSSFFYYQTSEQTTQQSGGKEAKPQRFECPPETFFPSHHRTCARSLAAKREALRVWTSYGS